MQLPSIRTQTNKMSASSPAQESPSNNLATSADGKSIHKCDTIVITWQSINPPRSVSPEGAYGHFSTDHTSLTASGSYTWQVPIYVSLPIPCAPDRTGGCVGSMNHERLQDRCAPLRPTSSSTAPPRPTLYSSRQLRAMSLSCYLRVRAGRIFRDSALNLGTRGCYEATPLSLTRSLNSLLMTGCVQVFGRRR
jgi:hypothetical protein